MAASPAMSFRTAWFALLLVVAFAGRGLAQEPATQFADLSKYVKVGSKVFVTDEKGERTRGQISELTSSTVHVRTGGFRDRTVTFAADRVERVSKIDSKKNGFLIGLIAGAVPGVLASAAWSSWSNNEGGGHTPLAYLYIGVPVSLLGGWIGFGIDGLIDGQTLIYRRPAATMSVKF